MKNLLNKPLRAFAWYAFVVLMCSIPVYYLIVDTIWRHELKEHNRIQAREVKQNLNTLVLSDQELNTGLELWNKLHPETKLQPTDAVRPDSTYNIYRRNKYIPSKGKDRFQGLVTYFLIHDKPYSLTLELNMEESYETIFYITLTTLVFFVALLGGFILLNRRISARLWQPFYHTLDKVRNFDLNDQQLMQLDSTDVKEFSELNTNLQKLIERNIEVYKHQKEFTENASHELQTPLAIVQSKLDLLLQSHSLTAEQFAIIDETNKALSRVSRINKNLLLLAKIENQQFPGKEPVPISLVLKENLEQLDEFSSAKEIRVETAIQPDVTIESNKILVEILLNNLVLNAIRHTKPGGLIKIILSATTLTVFNSGSATLQSSNLFKRFSSASPETPGSGLGLAIVSEICKLYGWQISYRFGDQQHIFCITWH